AGARCRSDRARALTAPGPSGAGTRPGRSGRCGTTESAWGPVARRRAARAGGTGSALAVARRARRLRPLPALARHGRTPSRRRPRLPRHRGDRLVLLAHAWRRPSPCVPTTRRLIRPALAPWPLPGPAAARGRAHTPAAP